MSFIRQHKGAVVWSFALHVAVAAAVAIGLPWRIERPRVPVAATAPIIEGTIIDRAAIEREQAKRDEAARAERQQQQREERRRREAAEQQRLADQREQQRVADAQRARDEAARKEQERVAAEKAEQQRRDEQARAEREAQAKRERERAAQRQREEEMLRAAALEAEANAARQAGLEDQYIRDIERAIRQEWQKPLSARPGLECVVSVVQTLTGDVVRAAVTSCNGDDAVRRSIESAVMKASPLPRPPHPSLFQRDLNVTFRPEE